MPQTLLYEMMAEFLGTLVILLLGGGVVAMVQLFGNGIPGEIVNGGATNINLAWGLAVMMGVAVSNRVSGAHLNPAVTVSMAIFRGFSWSKVLPYIAAQMLGAFSGAALVFYNYRHAFMKQDPLLEKTAGIFATFPAFPDVPLAGFVDQVIGTAILLFLVSALTDENNVQAPPWMTPLLVGAVVVAIGMSFGALHGYAINPARDLGPRLFTVLAGFRNNGLTDGTGIWIIPFFAPFLGGIVGTAAYDFTVRKALQ
ncbi:MAG: aquaporin family protein [Acidobacteria bacterium]|nr:aquaporin family protein [Acidobacteriota bacterium]